jgi:hypothetical protein
MKTNRLMLIIIINILAHANVFGSNLEQLGDRYLETVWRFHPVSATSKGVHTYDTLLADYSKKALKTMKKDLESFTRELDMVDTSVLAIDDIVDYHLIRASIEDELFDLNVIKAYEKNPLVYSNECIYGVYTILLNPAQGPQKRMQAIWQRIEQIPDYLDNAIENLDHPAQFFCDLAVEQLNSGTAFINGVCEVYIDSLDEQKKDEFSLLCNKAIAAMKLFSVQIQMQADPRTPYVLGRTNFDYLLRHIHLLDIDGDSLLKIGQHTLDSISILIDSLEQIHREPAGITIKMPENFGKEDIEAYRDNEIMAVREFVIRSGIVTIPDYIGDIDIIETPEFLRGLIPGLAMQPPPAFDSVRTSYFYVPPVPEHLSIGQIEYYYNYVYNRQFRSGVVHEAYPGHHLQLSIANQQPSNIRKSFHDFIFMEGWALYCEEIMARSKLFQDDTLGALINALQGVKFRALRVIVDVMMQTGQMSYDEAVDYMTRKSGQNGNYISREVGRYLTNPGQASSYLLGKVQLMALLDDYRAEKAGDFVAREFHDELLSHGSIPFNLIRKLMLAKIMP